MGLPRAIVVLLAAAIVCWATLELAPGDPRERAARVAGLLPADGVVVDPAAKGRAIEAAARAREVASTPLGRLVPMRLSWRDGREVVAHLGATWPATLALVGQAAVLVLVLGVGAGFLAARGIGDRAVGLATALALAVPVAWLCVLALRWPIAPALCLALAAAAALARVVRATLLELRGATFVQAARARGASENRAMVHALAAAGAPLIGYTPALLGWLLGAAPVVERAFGIPGAGALFLDAAAIGDAPLVTGVVLSSAALVVSTSLLSARLAAWLDPR